MKPKSNPDHIRSRVGRIGMRRQVFKSCLRISHPGTMTKYEGILKAVHKLESDAGSDSICSSDGRLY